VALPLNMFYNTGIATYIWVLSNRKPKQRRGRVQLIDATQWFKPLRKNLGMMLGAGVFGVNPAVVAE
jgi:type I restriction enzyme M protein